MIKLDEKTYINLDKIKTIAFNQNGEAVVVFDDDKEVLYVNDQARALKLGLAEEPGDSGGITQFKEFLSNYNPMLLVDESLSLAFSEFEKRNAR